MSQDISIAPAGSSVAPNNTITFNIGTTEIMRLDCLGMVYKGQHIEDGGDAHRAFLEVMAQMKQ